MANGLMSRDLPMIADKSCFISALPRNFLTRDK